MYAYTLEQHISIYLNLYKYVHYVTPEIIFTKTFRSPKISVHELFKGNETKPYSTSERLPTYCTSNNNRTGSIRSLLKLCEVGKLLGVQHKSFNTPKKKGT
jgi:hypothetical protein